MDENINEEVELEEDEAIDDSDFDAGWDDDSGDSDESFDLSEPTDYHDEEEAEPSEESEEETEEVEQDSAEPEAEEEGSQLFTINYLGNEEKLTWDQVKELAEKGRNYDHVKEERDSLRGERDKYQNLDKHEQFLKDLAERSGLTVDEQIDRTMALWLMNEEADKGNDISETEALLRVQRGRTQAAEQAQQKAASDEEAANQAAIQRFMAIYPDVKTDDIPQEVWDKANEVKDILGPYQAWLMKNLKAENDKLKQNAKNKERSTGSRRTAGAPAKPDSFDEGWDS